jgi:hypothetical protein
MSTEYENVEATIRQLFSDKQERDLAALRKTNQELRPLIDNSNRVLKGMIDVNTLPLPPSQKAE